jgi:lipopolysaccharide transport system permease protein
MTATLTAARHATRAVDVTQDISFGARHALAVQDLRDAIALWRLCWTLSWLDIKLRYRGSTLGPLWLTLSTAVMVGALGLLNSALFGVPLRDYLPFLALSLVLWGFLSGLIGDACLCFTSVEGMIRSVRMPFSLYAGQIVLRNLLILAHNWRSRRSCCGWSMAWRSRCCSARSARGSATFRPLSAASCRWRSS